MGSSSFFDSSPASSSALGPGTSVVQLSVALEVPDRDNRNSILSVLDRYSKTANMDSRKGVQQLTSQIALEVLRRKSSIVSASSSNKHFMNNNNAGDKATMAVVTFVIAIDGDQTRLNKIDSVTDVEQALRQIASDSTVDDCLQNAEILWTPEDRSEALSVRDIVADYPQLRAI